MCATDCNVCRNGNTCTASKAAARLPIYNNNSNNVEDQNKPTVGNWDKIKSWVSENKVAATSGLIALILLTWVANSMFKKKG